MCRHRGDRWGDEAGSGEAGQPSPAPRVPSPVLVGLRPQPQLHVEC